MDKRKNHNSSRKSTPTKEVEDKKGKKNNKNNDKNNNSQQSMTPKKKLFGSWTGKTPLSLLHEHCQKNGWSKPSLNVLNTSGKYQCHITLFKKDLKTGENRRVTFSCDKICDTEQEAKQYCATYTLYRVNSHMPMHRVLPPDHSKYWHELDEKRKESGKDKEYLYLADPFEARNVLAKIKNEKVAEHEKRKEEKEKRRDNLPKLHISPDLRQKIEDLIRDYKLDISEFATGKSSNDDGDEEKELDGHERRKIVKSLVKKGFREANIKEALKFTSNYKDALNWLIINLPEDVSNSQINLVQRNTKASSLKNEYMYNRIISLGYLQEKTEELLEKTDYNEYETMIELYYDYITKNGVETTTIECDYSQEEIDGMKNDEIFVLQSTYENQFSQPNEQTLSVVISNIKAEGETRLNIHIPKSCNYPFAIPAIAIWNDKIPLYIRRHLMLKLGELASTILGACMVFDLVSWLEQNIDNIIKNPPNLIAVYDDKKVITTKKSTNNKKNDSSSKSKENTTAKKSKSKKRKAIKNDPEVNEHLLKKLKEKEKEPKYIDMLKYREKLPSYKYQDPIIDGLEENQVIIISGETGCGKSTQTPQFILDHFIKNNKGSLCNIYCTQPRRISAMSLAARVAAERNEEVGESIGYIIRGESVQSKDTHLTFITTGVLLRILLNDPDLNSISHIIVDEVHERNVDTDFLLIFLKELISRRKDVKVILMSATLNSELFSSYFDDAPVFEIPGFTYPVKEVYLEDIYELIDYEPRYESSKKDKDKDKSLTKEDEEMWAKYYSTRGYNSNTLRKIQRYDKESMKVSANIINYELIGKVVEYICNKESTGDILIFLPGVMEIRKCMETLRGMYIPALEILPLHANLTPQEQYKVFKEFKNKRKVIVSTNVAETSVTIDGITHVIDSGRVKEMKYNVSQSMMTLVEEWASRASCKQRRGRAGRTQPGTCYKVYTHRTEEVLMLETTEPEILRTPLDQLCLQIKAMGINDVVDFLLKAIDPPAFANIDMSIKNLKEIKALDSNEKLTPMGYHMSTIPADLRIGKTLLYGCILQCIDPILTICSALSCKSPFVMPIDHREEVELIKKKFDIEKSDLLTDYNAFSQWYDIHKTGTKSEERAFCEENFLSMNTLYSILSLKKQYYQNLKDIGFINDSVNKHSEEYPIIKAALVAGMYPNILKVKHPETSYIETLQGNVARDFEAKNIKLYSKNDGRLFIHPSSVNFSVNKFEDGFLLYFNKVQTTKAYVRDCTMVSAYPIFLFGGEITTDLEGILMNGLRKILDRILIEKVKKVNLDISNNDAINLIIEILNRNGE
ncbi:P-loop containing nucleoside triphosphate hydrolase protein [Neocallimastix sp. 'constans']